MLLTAVSATAQRPEIVLDTFEVDVGSRTTDALPVATRAVEIFTAHEIARIPARNVKDVLGWLLGVNVRGRSPAQADLTIRGSSSEQVLVLVDGMRVSDTQTGHFDLDLALPLAEIARIEVLRGPASALYGTDAVGGVVNIVTRRARDNATGMTARLLGGSFGTAGGSISWYAGERDQGLRIAGEFRRSDGHRAGTDYRLWKARAAGHTGVAGGSLRAHLAFAARDFGAKFFYTPPESNYDEYEETRTLTASIGWRAPADARLAVEPRLSLRRHDDRFVLCREPRREYDAVSGPCALQPINAYENVHTTWQLGGEVVARYAVSSGLRLAIGAEAFRDIIESTSLGDRAESRAALFGELALGHVYDAAFTAGLRADWHSVFGTFIAPSLAGSVRPMDYLRLRASVGRAFRAPTWTDRYYEGPENLGSTDLEPETSRSAELGLDLFPVTGVRLSLAGFLRESEDLIDWARPVNAPADAAWRARNIAHATFRGLELKAEFGDVLGASWTARASFISFEADSTAAGFQSKYALRPLTRSVSLTADRRVFGPVRASARVRYARRPGGPAYTTGAVRVTYSRDNLRVYLDVTNIAAADYLDVSRVPVPGRALYVGVTWNAFP